MAYKKILCGVDGSETSLQSLKYAAELTKTQGAELVVLSVYKPPDKAQLAQWKGEAPPEFQWQITEHAAADAALEKAKKVAEGMDVTVTIRSERGDAADTMITVAEQEGADLIVVGNRGMSGAKRYVLGSVPNSISHHSPCDLLIIDTVGPAG